MGELIFKLSTGCVWIVFVIALYLRGVFGIGSVEFWIWTKIGVFAVVFCTLMTLNGWKWEDEDE